MPKHINKVKSLTTGSFFIVIISVFLGMLMVFSYESSLAKDALSEVGPILPSVTVGITAIVEESLGSKLLNTGFGKAIYQVFGNFKKGFAILNNENGERVYQYSNIPGDGIQVEVDYKSGNNKYQIVPNF